jgi:hypothetical protein
MSTINSPITDSQTGNLLHLYFCHIFGGVPRRHRLPFRTKLKGRVTLNYQDGEFATVTIRNGKDVKEFFLRHCGSYCGIGLRFR